MSYSKENILIITGEVSGNLYGAMLIEQLKQYKQYEFWGIGGDEMLSKGFENLYHINDLSIIGLIEAIKNARRISKMKKHIVNEATKRNPSKIIFIDTPGFNLGLAKQLRKYIKAEFIYFVSPQIWAWHYSRIKTIKKTIDLMLVFYPFEKRIYDKEGVKCTWIGHPIIDTIQERLNKPPIEVPKNKTAVCLLPGSRKQEVLATLPVYKEIINHNPDKYFLLPYSNKELKPIIDNYIQNAAEIVFDNTLQAIKAADIVIACSGTVTLEIAYLGKPFMIVYKVHPLTYAIAKMVVKIPYIGMVNIIANEFIVKEFLQKHFNAKNIQIEMERIWTDTAYRNTMLKKLKAVKEQLGDGTAIQKAAKAIMGMISDT